MAGHTLQIALDGNTHDLILKEGGGIERVGGGRFVIQQVQCKLRTILGEWALDPLIGLINLDDFEKGFELFDLEMRARRIILGTQGVLSIVHIDSQVSRKNRIFTIEFAAKTIYGTISSEVPWHIPLTNIGS